MRTNNFAACRRALIAHRLIDLSFWNAEDNGRNVTFPPGGAVQASIGERHRLPSCGRSPTQLTWLDRIALPASVTTGIAGGAPDRSESLHASRPQRAIISLE
jgi:hypothetical protein